MAMCEDAPCCGCCGPALDMADHMSMEEAYYEQGNGDSDDFWPDPLEDEDE